MHTNCQTHERRNLSFTCLFSIAYNKVITNGWLLTGIYGEFARSLGTIWRGRNTLDDLVKRLPNST